MLVVLVFLTLLILGKWLTWPTSLGEANYREMLRKQGLTRKEIAERLIEARRQHKLPAIRFRQKGEPARQNSLRLPELVPVEEEEATMRRALRIIRAIQETGEDWREYVDREMKRRGLD